MVATAKINSSLSWLSQSSAGAAVTGVASAIQRMNWLRYSTTPCTAPLARSLSRMPSTSIAAARQNAQNSVIVSARRERPVRSAQTKSGKMTNVLRTGRQSCCCRKTGNAVVISTPSAMTGKMIQSSSTVAPSGTSSPISSHDSSVGISSSPGPSVDTRTGSSRKGRSDRSSFTLPAPHQSCAAACAEFVAPDLCQGSGCAVGELRPDCSTRD